jgi:hypothetical protein
MNLSHSQFTPRIAILVLYTDYDGAMMLSGGHTVSAADSRDNGNSIPGKGAASLQT